MSRKKITSSFADCLSLGLPVRETEPSSPPPPSVVIHKPKDFGESSQLQAKLTVRQNYSVYNKETEELVSFLKEGLVDLEKIKQLTSKNINYKYIDSEGNNLLHLGLISHFNNSADQLAILTILLKNNVDVSHKNHRDLTPIDYANICAEEPINIVFVSFGHKIATEKTKGKEQHRKQEPLIDHPFKKLDPFLSKLLLHSEPDLSGDLADQGEQ